MNGQTRRFVITIDGPAGAGKSTVSKKLARRLGYVYVDTGAMYRAVAVLARNAGQGNPLEEKLLAEICSSLDLKFVNINRTAKLLVNGEDITEEIRNSEISALASAVSAKAVVRERLTRIQRELGAGGGVVLEGRDMGTVVFPDAEVKFFLEASPEIRSQRRHAELAARGEEVTLNEVYEQIFIRDRNDQSRDLAPLRASADAIVVDSSNLEIEEVVQVMLDHVEAKCLEFS